MNLSAILAAMATVMAGAQTVKPPEPRQIRANGVDLQYVEQGSGAPVVFVHGAVSDLRFWEPQRDAFAKKYRFVAYSYRYHGMAPWPDDGKLYSADTHAADLAALIAALRAGPVHLVGLSYGGLLAAMVAIKEPQLLRTLTLAEPGIFSLLADSPDGKATLEKWNKGAEPMIAAMKAGDSAGAIRHLDALVTGNPPDHFDTLPAPFRQMLADNARTMQLLFAAPPALVTCDMLRGIKTPTLVVRGERTTEFFVKTNAEVGRCVAGSKLIVIPKASHPMSYENPSGFNRALLAFLAQQPSPSAARRPPAS